MRGARSVTRSPPYEPDDASDAWGVCPGGPTRDGTGHVPVKTWFPTWGALSWSFVGWP
jgi:hypothetical protein